MCIYLQQLGSQHYRHSYQNKGSRQSFITLTKTASASFDMASFKIVIIIALIALINAAIVTNDSSSVGSTGLYAGTSGIHAGTKSWGIDAGEYPSKCMAFAPIYFRTS
jgi:hypothetical protein